MKFKIGSFVKIRNSGYGVVQIVEDRGLLGTQIYGVMAGNIHLEVREDQLEPVMKKEELKEVLQEVFKNLHMEVETRGYGHMGAVEYWLVVTFDGTKMTEVLLRREECPEEWS